MRHNSNNKACLRGIPDELGVVGEVAGHKVIA